MNLEYRLMSAVRTVPDFPKQGISFKDITPVLEDAKLCADIADALVAPYLNLQIDRVVGVESRGFLFGMLMAQRLGCGFTLVRKQGKLPWNTYEASYDLEYGQATIEIHRDAVSRGHRVIIHDDILATGGTSQAAAKLLKIAGADIIGFNFLIELSFLHGRECLQPFTDNVVSIVKYD